MTYDPHAIIFPDRLEVDVKAEAELPERHRVAEVEGLRRELEQLAAQREQLTTEKPVAEMVISDTRTGKRVPHLRVERISVGLAAERIEEGIAEIDLQIEAVLKQLEYRGEVSEVPKLPGPTGKGSFVPKKPKL